jgi:serine protease
MDTTVSSREDFTTRPVPPEDRRHSSTREQYSGFIIVRLASGLPMTHDDDLLAMAKRLKLAGLGGVLDEYRLATSRRVVRSLKPTEIVKLERRAEASEFRPLHSLTAYWRIDVRDRSEKIGEILARLNQLREVDLAYREAVASDPVVNDADDDYAADQDYLDAAPTGIDARWAWTQPGGEGAGVGIVDLEQGWFLGHEEFVTNAPQVIYGDNHDGINGYVGNHGSAVLGEMIAEDNAVGVVGVAPGVTSVRVASHYDAGTDTTGHVADAILAAIPVMAVGDVLLLEIQKGFLPTETDEADFDAIRLAVAHGIVVVAAAGNGNSDLDAFMNASGEFVLDRGSPDFRDSGAILVGAALSALPHDRKTASNFGSRVDCYAWGQNVVTCGYGDLDDGGGDNNLTYTSTFSNTSAAAPIVAGAALVVQGRYESDTATRLSPTQMRALLSDPAMGTAQGPNVAGNIGIMPDLRAIIEDALGLVPDIYLRDNPGDSGVVPATGSISQSPDIIVRPAPVADPVAEFGEGSGNEDSTTLGFEVEAGQPNYIYARIQNRGTSDADGVIATIYWSPPATLVTPDLWTLIGTTAPVNVPQGNTIVIAGPLTWPAVEIPATGHYCFVGVLNHLQDPAPPLPGPGDWDDFTALIRDWNNVTWRNFNVVDEFPDPNGEDPSMMPFLIAGAPDRPRVFELEILRDLPRDAKARLQVPLGLAAKLRKAGSLKMQIDHKRRFATIELPPIPRIRLSSVRLGAGARYPSRFLVHGSKAMEGGGHSIAIRQLFEKQEVGRVTWQYVVRKGQRKRERREVSEYRPERLRELVPA